MYTENIIYRYLVNNVSYKSLAFLYYSKNEMVVILKN